MKIMIMVFLLSALAWAQSPGDLYNNGMSSYNSGRYSEAAIDLIKAARQHHKGAIEALGHLYQKKDALAYIKKTAGDGDAPSQYILGQLYFSGTGFQQDYNLAARWLSSAAEQEYADAQRFLGMLYHANKEYSRAFYWFYKAAALGEPYAQNMVGVMYLNGQGVKVNTDSAILWFTKAAGQSNADAYNNLGVIYYQGLGVEKEYTTAFNWFIKAADSGHVHAHAVLGMMCADGHGTEQNYTEALKHYEIAADAGDYDATMALAKMYEDGTGVHKNSEKAEELMKRAQAIAK